MPNTFAPNGFEITCMMDAIAVDKLHELGIKTQIKSFSNEDRFSQIVKRYYILDNGKYLMVMFECGELKSIVRQKDAFKGFTFSINGQASKNSEQIYYWYL